MRLLNLFILSLVVIILASCDNRFDFLNDLNQKPVVVIIDKEGAEVDELRDSLKTSLKIGSDKYYLSLKVSDFEGLIQNLTYSIEVGDGTFYQGNDQNELSGSISFDDNGLADIMYAPDLSIDGLHKIEFTVTDNLGNSSTAVLNLFVFENIEPVAARNITLIGVNDQYEYDLDATGSYDQDFNFGGRIAIYEWEINGVKLTSKTEISRFIFPSAGNYEIKVRVQDNDGAWSPVKTGVPLTLN